MKRDRWILPDREPELVVGMAPDRRHDGISPRLYTRGPMLRGRNT
ncbi:hypothetical protein ACFVW8_38310 [Streptomyces sp. NPDC058221]